MAGKYAQIALVASLFLNLLIVAGAVTMTLSSAAHEEIAEQLHLSMESQVEHLESDVGDLRAAIEDSGYGGLGG